MNDESRKKLKLFELAKISMLPLKGGVYVKCCCACAYSGSGGSSTADNGSANFASGLISPQCPNLN